MLRESCLFVADQKTDKGTRRMTMSRSVEKGPIFEDKVFLNFLQMHGRKKFREYQCKLDTESSKIEGRRSSEVPRQTVFGHRKM